MPRLLGIGEAMGEMRPETADTLRLAIAGDVFNTLAYVRALGGSRWDLGLVSRIGDDPMSCRLLARCAGLGIEALVGTEPGSALGLYLISTDEAGERSFSYWRSASPARRLVASMTEAARVALARADLVLLSGITIAILDEPQRERLATLLAESRARGTRIAFDPNYRARLWLDAAEARGWIERFYRLSDIAFPGVDDHGALFDERDSAAVLAHPALAGAAEVVVKAGKAGVIARVGAMQVTAPFVAPPRTVDTTAAGDAFNAGWLVARHAGLDPSASAGFAARAAAAVAAHPGAIVPFDTLPSLPGHQETDR